jgi:propionate CoA-transferase
MTVTELAPGVDLQRDVLDKAAFKLDVADDLREMDARLFRPEPMNRALTGGAL